MIEGGAIEEVRRLLARALSPTLPVMRAIGVPQIAAHLKDLSSLEEAIAAGQLATRQYAKRQRTWFRGQDLGIGLEAGPEAALRKLLDDAKDRGC